MTDQELHALADDIFERFLNRYQWAEKKYRQKKKEIVQDAFEYALCKAPKFNPKKGKELPYFITIIMSMYRQLMHKSDRLETYRKAVSLLRN